MEVAVDRRAGGSTPGEDHEEEAEDNRAQQRDPSANAEIQQIKALLRRNVIVSAIAASTSKVLRQENQLL